jgi:hypothetical protein
MAKAKVENQFLSPTELTKAQQRAYDLFMQDRKLCIASDVEKARHEAAYKKTEVSAKELGKAFLKVKQGCRHGDFKKWFSKFRASANRVNYCMRVAQGKVGKTLKPNPLGDATKNFAHGLKNLYKFARAGEKENGEKLMVRMYESLQTFWKGSFVEPEGVEVVEERVNARIYELRLEKKRRIKAGLDTKKIDRQIKDEQQILAEAEYHADPDNHFVTVIDPSEGAMAAAAAAAAGAYTE